MFMGPAIYMRLVSSATYASLGCGGSRICRRMYISSGWAFRLYWSVVRCVPHLVARGHIYMSQYVYEQWVDV